MSSAAGDFSLADLYGALDAERKKRALSWSEAARQMARESGNNSGHRLSVSTIIATRTAKVAEADGILQMLVWLGRTPESFVAGHPSSDSARFQLPKVPPHKVLRFDTKALHAAVDQQRRAQKLTWLQVADAIGAGESALRHLAKGGRTSFPQVMRIVRWLKMPAADFTRASDF
jgi:hypothetical protein